MRKVTFDIFLCGIIIIYHIKGENVVKIMILPYLVSLFIFICALFWIIISDYRPNNIKQYFIKCLLSSSIISIIVVNSLVIAYVYGKNSYYASCTLSIASALSLSKLYTARSVESILSDLSEDEVEDKEILMPKLRRISSTNILWLIYTIICIPLIFYTGYKLVNRFSAVMVFSLLYLSIDLMGLIDVNIKYSTKYNKFLKAE